MSECRDCRTIIDSSATRCHHCGSFQNWQRYLGTGSLLAGFLLTWISIWAASPIQEFLEEEEAIIELSILDGDFMNVRFMLANTGNRPAGLMQIQITGGSGTWYLQSELDNQLIEPGRAYIIEAENGSTIPAPVSHEMKEIWRKMSLSPNNKECALRVNYVQLNGYKEILVYPFLCDRIDPEENKKFIESLRSHTQ